MRKLVVHGPEWKYSSITAKGFFWLLKQHRELTGQDATLVNRTVYFDDTFPVHSVIFTDEEAAAVLANLPAGVQVRKSKP